MTLRSYQEVAQEALERNDRDTEFEALFADIEDRLKRLVLLSQMEISKPRFYQRDIEVCTMQAEWFLEEMQALRKSVAVRQIAAE